MSAPALVLLLAAVASSPALAAQADGKETAADAYRFPLQPGTPAWRELRTNDEMLAACQVPEDALAAMSTPGLVQTCLMYPLAYTFMAFTTFDKGIDTVISRFNGLRELMARKDGASALLAAYRSLDPKAGPACVQDPERGCRFQWMYVEGLLGHDAMRTQLTPQERIDLLMVCCRNGAVWRGDPSFGMIHLRAVGGLMGRLLIDADYEPFVQAHEAREDLRAFLRDFPGGALEVFDEVVSHADHYLTETAGEGGKR